MTQKPQIIPVPAADAVLHTERSGHGPAVVLVPGGGGDAEMFEAVVPLLADRYTVITLDRRGNSRSKSETLFSLAQQAADVITVLDHHGIDRAYVFGTSASGIIALELLAHHDDRLLGAVVHEPPIIRVLPDRAEQAASIREVGRITDEEGALPGWLRFASMIMPGTGARLFTSRFGRAAGAALLRLASAAQRVRGREPGGMQRIIGNAEWLLKHEMPVLVDYRPDVDALRATSAPWCFAVGTGSAGEFYERPARLLGAELGIACAEFPGGHASYQQEPTEFSARLTAILDGFAARGGRRR
ncbi:alpha/beta hydrolase [Saccharopolyspora sp. NPDC050389]|uniref:alpha/beta fold hydrolase n=1 Tax=Saccharopolyspora sp. NPDC050389 TaxID=3155516 RepID=UPI0033D2CB7A